MYRITPVFSVRQFAVITLGLCEPKVLRIQKLSSRKTGGLGCLCLCPPVKGNPGSVAGNVGGTNWLHPVTSHFWTISVSSFFFWCLVIAVIVKKLDKKIVPPTNLSYLVFLYWFLTALCGYLYLPVHFLLLLKHFPLKYFHLTYLKARVTLRYCWKDDRGNSCSGSYGHILAELLHLQFILHL